MVWLFGREKFTKLNNIRTSHTGCSSCPTKIYGVEKKLNLRASMLITFQTKVNGCWSDFSVIASDFTAIAEMAHIVAHLHPMTMVDIFERTHNLRHTILHNKQLLFHFQLLKISGFAIRLCPYLVSSIFHFSSYLFQYIHCSWQFPQFIMKFPTKKRTRSN